MSGMTEESPAILASDEERDRTTERLRQASVEGRLTLDEFTRRIEETLSARTRGELAEITRDLPATSGLPVAQSAGAPAYVAPDARTRSPIRSSVAIMSSIDRKGFWRVSDRSTAVAAMGSVKLDLRSASISSSVTTIEAQAIMGSIIVIVPYGVEVELEGIAIMGSKEAKLTGPPPPPGAPIVRINAFSLMGSVIVRDKGGLGERLRSRIEEHLGDAPR
jgi:hypothetical protein